MYKGEQLVLRLGKDSAGRDWDESLDVTGAEIGYSGQRIECSGDFTTQGNKGIEGRLQGANDRKEGAGSTIKQDGLQRINGVHIVRPFLFLFSYVFFCDTS